MSRRRPFLMPTARLLHIHLSMLALLFLFLYAISGLILNHPETLGSESAAVESSVQLAPGLTVEQAVTAVRAAGQVRGRLESSEAGEDELRLVFARPGYRAEVVINRGSGAAAISVEDRGVVGVLEDLHRGKHVGGAWRLASDAAAIILATVVLTGVVLWWSLPVRRKWGTVWLVLGAVTLAGVVAVTVYASVAR